MCYSFICFSASLMCTQGLCFLYLTVRMLTMASHGVLLPVSQWMFMRNFFKSMMYWCLETIPYKLHYEHPTFNWKHIGDFCKLSHVTCHVEFEFPTLWPETMSNILDSPVICSKGLIHITVKSIPSVYKYYSHFGTGYTTSSHF